MLNPSLSDMSWRSWTNTISGFQTHCSWWYSIRRYRANAHSRYRSGRKSSETSICIFSNKWIWLTMSRLPSLNRYRRWCCCAHRHQRNGTTSQSVGSKPRCVALRRTRTYGRSRSDRRHSDSCSVNVHPLLCNSSSTFSRTLRRQRFPIPRNEWAKICVKIRGSTDCSCNWPALSYLVLAWVQTRVERCESTWTL